MATIQRRRRKRRLILQAYRWQVDIDHTTYIRPGDVESEQGEVPRLVNSGKPVA